MLPMSRRSALTSSTPRFASDLAASLSGLRTATRARNASLRAVRRRRLHLALLYRRAPRSLGLPCSSSPLVGPPGEAPGRVRPPGNARRPRPPCSVYVRNHPTTLCEGHFCDERPPEPTAAACIRRHGRFRMPLEDSLPLRAPITSSLSSLSLSRARSAAVAAREGLRSCAGASPG